MSDNKPMKILPQDKVYLKNSFKEPLRLTERYINEQILSMEGQRVIITSTIISYGEDKKKIETFICKKITGLSPSITLPLICIDRSQPLVRNGRKYTLKNKNLYISD